MDFKLPFDEGTVDGMSGRTMVVAENHRNSNVFRRTAEAKVDAGDVGGGWAFQADRGALRLTRGGQAFCDFRGVESRGGKPYAVGHRTDVEAKHGFDRVVLYEKRLLAPAKLGVCVSSHVEYEKKTLEPLLKSLRKTGFDMAKVVVMVDGDKKWRDWQDDRSDEVRVVRGNFDAMGFAGLVGAACSDWSKDVEYWLLAHDTCEFENDFVSRMAGFDVGLEQDVVLLAPPEQKKEMGLYSARFLASSRVDVEGTRPGLLFDAYMAEAQTVTCADGKVEVLGSKDVYGSGTPRKVCRVVSAGIRKYEGKDARGGRP